MPTSVAGNSVHSVHGARSVAIAIHRHKGFTLLELLITVSIMALATAGVSFALRDSTSHQLEREGQRLAAILESARAQSRASGVAVQWHPIVGGFRLDGMPAATTHPSVVTWQWLHTATQARSDHTAASTSSTATWATSVMPTPTTSKSTPPLFLVLGPEPLIGPQQIVLSRMDHPTVEVRVLTDGLRPFRVEMGP